MTNGPIKSAEGRAQMAVAEREGAGPECDHHSQSAAAVFVSFAWCDDAIDD